MLSILDRIYVRNKKINPESEAEFSSTPRTIYQDASMESWYCFDPRIVTGSRLLSRGYLPKHGKIRIYTISSFRIITPNPDETLDKLNQIYWDATNKIQEDLRDGLTINLMGISLGNVLSVRLASQMPEGKLKNLVSVVGGGRLGLSAWDSSLTGDIVRKSGLSREEYESKVSEFSPMNHLYSAKPERVFARFGTSDILIPYKHGRELKRGLEKLKCEKDIKSYFGADHCSAISLTSLAGIHKL